LNFAVGTEYEPKILEKISDVPLDSIYRGLWISKAFVQNIRHEKMIT